MLVRAGKYVMPEHLAKRIKHRGAPNRLDCKPFLEQGRQWYAT